MPVLFNNTLYPTLPPDWAVAQRALYYGDALFESMRMLQGKVPLLDLHVERLLKGLKLIGIDYPSEWDSAFFQEKIAQLGLYNGRIRLMVWRSSGGLYLPQNNTAQYIIQGEHIENGSEWGHNPARRVTIAQQVQLPIDCFSGVKSFNTARYVQAAREADSRGFDDALVLNAQGEVAEATSSNIFWLKNGIWHTPPLSSGCVAGVMRSWLLAQMKAQAVAHTEQPAPVVALMEAETLVLCNAVRGIISVAELDGIALNQEAGQALCDLLP
jgi:branched-subunit amino acid aminotransferase/4-amino-4-deoxychorismate lyase